MRSWRRLQRKKIPGMHRTISLEAVLTASIVVPEGITLEFSSVSKVYLTAGHTLTVNGTLLMQQQLYVAGNLVVNGNVTVDAADGEGSYFLDMFDLSLGGIAVTDTGSCSVNGSIRVAKIDYSGQLMVFHGQYR